MEDILKQKTGIGGLDDILSGGLPKGRATVIRGHHGTGKTFIGLEMLYRQAQAGVPGLFLTFEEDRESLLRNARAVGWELEPLEEKGLLKILSADISPATVFSGEFSIEGAISIIRAAAQQLKAGIFVLDAVDWLLELFEDRKDQINNLQSIYNLVHSMGLTTLITVKEHFVEQTLLDYLADCVIFLDQRVETQVTVRRLRVTKYRGSGYLSNEHPFLLTAKGIRIIPVSGISLDHHSVGGRLTTGLVSLDSILDGGFMKGACIVVAGASGTGKTTMVSSFTVSACQRGEKVLFMSFEESVDSLVHSMGSPGLDMGTCLENGTLRILANLPESIGPDQQLLDIVTAVEEFSPQHVVIDSITSVERMGSPVAAFDFQVRLIYMLKNLGITSLLTYQSREISIGQEMGKLEIASIAECVIGLEQKWLPKHFDRSLAIIKSRGSSHSSGIFPFTITSQGLEIVEDAIKGNRSGG